MGLGAYRFSLEWSRIEPAEGEFSIAAMDYYRRICAACRERDIVPVVTFHHFTTPTWLTRRGGWEAADAPHTFARFVTRAGAHLNGRLSGVGVHDQRAQPHRRQLGLQNFQDPRSYRVVADGFARHLAINEAMVRAHRLGIDALRSGPGDFPVGLTLSMDEMVAEPGGESVLDAAREILEDRFFRATAKRRFCLSVSSLAHSRPALRPRVASGPQRSR